MPIEVEGNAPHQRTRCTNQFDVNHSAMNALIAVCVLIVSSFRYTYSIRVKPSAVASLKCANIDVTA